METRVGYSYFEKGCREKCATILKDIVGGFEFSFFLKKFERIGTKGHGIVFASAKGKQQKYVRQLQSSGTVY